MKKIALLSMAIMIGLSCTQKKQELPKNADVFADNLNGRVEQIIETDFKTDSTGKIGEQDSCCVILIKYNDKGYITEYTTGNATGTEKNEEVFTHYDNGAMKTVNNTKNGKRVNSISIRLNNDGKFAGIEESDYANETNFYYSDISQNDYVQFTAFKKYSADSALVSAMTSVYDKQIFKSSEIKDSKGKVIYSSAVKLDDKNNVIKKATTSVSNDSTTHEIFRYQYDSFDDKGNWTARTEMDERNKPIKITKRQITYY